VQECGNSLIFVAVRFEYKGCNAEGVADVCDCRALTGLILMQFSGIRHCSVKSFSEVCLWFCHLYLSNLFIFMPYSDGQVMSSKVIRSTPKLD
jgi:hypothetical protein